MQSSSSQLFRTIVSRLSLSRAVLSLLMVGYAMRAHGRSNMTVLPATELGYEVDTLSSNPRFTESASTRLTLASATVRGVRKLKGHQGIGTPANVTATAGINEVTVSWDGSGTGATSYDVYWNNSGSWYFLNNVTTSTYTDLDTTDMHLQNQHL